MNQRILSTIILGLSLSAIALAQPKVWIYSDMTDKTLPGNNKEHTINDPDDISAMAGYLLLANEFDTKGIVIASTHRKEHATTPNQKEWADAYFGKAYQTDLPGLNKNIGGYPSSINFMQSCIKESSEKYNPEKTYTDLSTYSTVKALLDVAADEPDTINVLCWGSLTEPAILVNYCIATGKTDILKKLRFIAHWTNSPLHQGTPEQPWKVANCNEDRQACEYLKDCAYQGKIVFYECGAIGQHGIVSGSPKGMEYFGKFNSSELGKIFITGKYVFNSVDHSDAATYWVLLGNYGVSLNDIAPNGTNDPEVEKANEIKFHKESKRIHDELLRRSIAASQK